VRAYGGGGRNLGQDVNELRVLRESFADLQDDTVVAVAADHVGLAHAGGFGGVRVNCDFGHWMRGGRGAGDAAAGRVFERSHQHAGHKLRLRAQHPVPATLARDAAAAAAAALRCYHRRRSSMCRAAAAAAANSW